MLLLNRNINRRRVLRGMLGGIGVTVALPLLDCFLNTNGTAFADGSALPVRFGTWFWGLGMDKDVFVPKKLGADYDLPPEIASWKDIKQHVNLFTNFNVLTDGKPAAGHFTGWVACRTGIVPAALGSLLNPTLDVLIADAISGASRFRALDCAATGSVKDTYSMRSGDSINPPDTSPVEFYEKIFGSEFQDPNSPEFTPKPSIMLRRSVLSGVREQSADVLKKVGAADRSRIDQYFTSLRELEQRLDLQMQKPPPAPTCKVPQSVKERVAPGTDVDLVAQRHRLMTDVMAMAVACNQARVFNMTYSSAQEGLSKKGLDKIHHTITHEEQVDEKLGYQPTNFMFITRAMESYAYFIKAFASIPEGNGTLLDNCAIYAHSDQENAKIHSINGVPMMVAGKAGGRFKTGLHIDGKGEAPSPVALTLLKTLGANVSEWGTGSMKTTKEISEIMA
jgi:hypothetical protein